LYSSVERSTGAAPLGGVSSGSLGWGLSESGEMPLYALEVVENCRNGVGGLQLNDNRLPVVLETTDCV
jgi:hypothetical protein